MSTNYSYTIGFSFLAFFIFDILLFSLWAHLGVRVEQEAARSGRSSSGGRQRNHQRPQLLLGSVSSVVMTEMIWPNMAPLVGKKKGQKDGGEREKTDK